MGADYEIKRSYLRRFSKPLRKELFPILYVKSDSYTKFRLYSFCILDVPRRFGLSNSIFRAWLQEIVFARAPPLSDSIADPRIVTLSRHVKKQFIQLAISQWKQDKFYQIILIFCRRSRNLFCNKILPSFRQMCRALSF